jgi:hypothetical protein
LVGVLSLVLGVVVFQQLPSSRPQSEPHNESSSPAVVSRERPTRRQRGSAQAASQTASSTKEQEKTDQPQPTVPRWPESPLPETLANNPFRLPAWAADNESLAGGEGPSELLPLQEQGASIVVIGNEVKSATVGDQTYHVGDVLEGYRITDITTQGILLDRLNSR